VAPISSGSEAAQGKIDSTLITERLIVNEMSEKSNYSAKCG